MRVIRTLLAIFLVFLKNLGVMLGMVAALVLLIASVVRPLVWISEKFAENPHLGCYLLGYTVAWAIVVTAAIITTFDL